MKKHIIESQESEEDFEKLYFKILEFKEDFINQIDSNIMFTEEYLQKASNIICFYNYYKDLEKNRLIIRQNLSSIRNNFLIYNQEKNLQFNKIDSKLKNIKNSVNSFYKKKKICKFKDQENIKMKEADNYSEKLNLRLMNNKINEYKKHSIDIENRIMEYKLENKNLYNLELEIINQILQLEKKVGEIAQNKNSISSNISLTKDAVSMLSNRMKNCKSAIDNVIINNEKKNVYLNRKLYQIKQEIRKVSEVLVNLSDKFSFIKNFTGIDQKILSCLKLMNNQFNFDCINHFMSNIDDKFLFETDKLKSFNSDIKGKIAYFEDSNFSLKNQLNNRFFSLKAILTNESNSIIRENFLKYISNNFAVRNNLLSNSNNENLLIVENECFSSQNFLGIFTAQKFKELKADLISLECIYKDQLNIIEEENGKIKKNLNSEKINSKIILKQIENLMKRNLNEKKIKKILKSWKALNTNTKKDFHFESNSSAFKRDSILNHIKFSTSKETREIIDETNEKNRKALYTTNKKDKFNRMDVIESLEDGTTNSQNKPLFNKIIQSCQEIEDKQSLVSEKEEKDMFQHIKHAQFKKSADQGFTKLKHSSDKLIHLETDFPIEKEKEGMKTEIKNNIDFDSVLSFKNFKFENINYQKSKKQQNVNSNLNQDNSIIKTKKKKENKKEISTINNNLNNFINLNLDLSSNQDLNRNLEFGPSNANFPLIQNSNNNNITSVAEKNYKNKEFTSVNKKGNRKSNKNNNNNSNNSLNSNLKSLNSNSTLNETFKMSFRPSISDFINNDNSNKNSAIEEQDDDIFKILQANVREANEIKPNNGERKRRFFENYLV